MHYIPSSSTVTTYVFPNLTPLVSLKLEGPNYITWSFTVIPILKSHDLMGIVDGIEPYPPQFLPPITEKEEPSLNPAFSLWVKKDQFILSWINITLAESVLSTIYGLQTSHQVWKFLATKSTLPSCTRIAQLCLQLQTLQQGSKSCVEYVNFAKLLAHQLATVGKAIEDDELITYILGGLNPAFNPFVVSLSLATRDSSLTVEDFTTELLSIEQLIENQQSSVGTDSSVALLSHKPSFNSSYRHSTSLLPDPLLHASNTLLDHNPTNLLPLLQNTLPTKFVTKLVIVPWTIFTGWTTPTKDAILLLNLRRWLLTILSSPRIPPGMPIAVLTII